MMSGKYAGLNMIGKKEIYDVLSAYSISLEGLKITFLGFVSRDPSVQVKIKRISDSSLVQFFVRDRRLDGCVLINDHVDRQMYQKVIESREVFQP